MNDCVMRGSYNLMFKSRMFLFHIGIRPRRRRTSTKPRWTVATQPPPLLPEHFGHDKVDRNRPPEILKETSEYQEKIVGGQTTMAIQKPGQTLYFEFAAHQY